MENLTDLDLVCLYAVVGGVNGKEVLDSVKAEQGDTDYSEKGHKLLKEVQRSVERPTLYDISDVPYLKLRLELVKRGLLGGDVKELKAFIKALEGETK